jgi:dolichol-phosphate mannosyltransferase
MGSLESAKKAMFPRESDESSGPRPVLSIVVPVRDEADSIRPLVAEIRAALDALGRTRPLAYEIVYVDDGSRDTTPDVLAALRGECPVLRVVRHRQGCGQSAAIATGVLAARAPVIVTLDGDGQNDPADIPRLVEVFDQAPDRDRLMVTGQRAQRRDTWLKRVSSRVANAIRAGLLKDTTPDTGCGLKIFPRAAFLEMPRFDHMHRFLPALMLRGGGRVVSVPVSHRPRARGASKYGLFDRLWVGIVDLLGVMWLQRRTVTPAIEEPKEPAP